MAFTPLNVVEKPTLRARTLTMLGKVSAIDYEATWRYRKEQDGEQWPPASRLHALARLGNNLGQYHPVRACISRGGSLTSAGLLVRPETADPGWMEPRAQP